MVPIDDWLAGAQEHVRKHHRPLITLSYAQSLDGSISANRGSPTAISGPQAMRLTHELRAAHDAILVGIGTILADNPHLTVRLVAGKNPQPVVLDSNLRFPPGANLIQEKIHPWIATCQPSAVQGKDLGEYQERASKLESMGYKTYVASVDLKEKGIWHRLLVGRFKSAKEASRMADEIKEYGEFPYVKVVSGERINK